MDKEEARKLYGSDADQPLVVPAEVQVFQPGEQRQPVEQSENLVLVARYPHQMEEAQKKLIAWAERKVVATQAEVADLTENVEIAKRNKWGSAALVRAATRSRKLLEYYEKALLALREGYCIVPDFPMEVFAVRTKKIRGEYASASWERELPDASSEGLPAGEGKWVDNRPLSRIEDRTITDNAGRSREITVYVTSKLNTEIDFPFVLAKPEVLEATSAAMASKIFDELGVLPGTPSPTTAGPKRKADPLVLGRIRDPRSTQYSRRYLTFMVAWFLETRTI